MKILIIFQDVDYDFKEGSVKFSKYMESFPFPYYLVLRNIESLPRTLADLLRQVSNAKLLVLFFCLVQLSVC